MLSKAKKFRMSAEELGFEGTDAVYVNEHLTRYGKQLLGAGKAKKEVHRKFVWTSGGKLFAKKDELSAVLKISGKVDLDKMAAEGAYVA